MQDKADLYNNVLTALERSLFAYQIDLQIARQTGHFLCLPALKCIVRRKIFWYNLMCNNCRIFSAYLRSFQFGILYNVAFTLLNESGIIFYFYEYLWFCFSKFNKTVKLFLKSIQILFYLLTNRCGILLQRK